VIIALRNLAVEREAKVLEGYPKSGLPDSGNWNG
jgi:hypothetical protein